MKSKSTVSAAIWCRFKKYRRIIGLLVLVMAPGLALPLFAQSNLDTLSFKTGLLIGEIKSLDKGVISIETSYSDKDFQVEWTEVKAIKSSSTFLITLRNGFRLNGRLNSYNDSGGVRITTLATEDKNSMAFQANLKDVVYMKNIKDKFWSRARASIDIGLNIARANNLRQYNTSVKLGYVGQKWMLDVFFQGLRSVQDSVAPTRRSEAGLTSTWFLPRDWVGIASLNFLSNTEQALDLRTSGKLGVGKFLVHTNSKYWLVGGGANINLERFSNETANRRSFEAFAVTEVNLFDIGDFSLFNSIYVFRTLTEGNRWRSDVKLDAKYKFWKDFYAKIGGSLNFDSKPAVEGREIDYVINFGFGWEL